MLKNVKKYSKNSSKRIERTTATDYQVEVNKQRLSILSYVTDRDGNRTKLE